MHLYFIDRILEQFITSNRNNSADICKHTAALNSYHCSCVSLIQKQYHQLHPKGELPVHLNDVLFSFHAISMNLILLLQCSMFDSGEQKVSMPMCTLVGGLWVTVLSTLGAAIMEKISWLQYIYYLSYIKVGTTPIKYTPQVSG